MVGNDDSHFDSHGCLSCAVWKMHGMGVVMDKNTPGQTPASACGVVYNLLDLFGPYPFQYVGNRASD